MDPRDLSISRFNYDLPEDRIAKYPLNDRDASRLLIYCKGEIKEDVYSNLDQHLPRNSLLLFNDTKVMEARLLFRKQTGATVEIFCLEPASEYDDVSKGMMLRGKALWLCLIGGASKWKHGQVLEKRVGTGTTEWVLCARFVGKRSDSFAIEFSWNNSFTFAEVLHAAGEIPLPPYLKRPAEKIDAERYQTIFAHDEGSVAAPTAGLHFTRQLLEKLKAKNISSEFLTLHVGAGTFKPVKSATLGGHEMHTELIKITRRTLEAILGHLDKTIVAVGTTSLRALESVYWYGAKLRSGDHSADIGQWEPYDLKYNSSPAESLQTILDFMIKEKSEILTLRTQIIIAPPYEVKMAHALLTNFHLPESTLLALVAAVTSNDWRKIYDYAISKNFRFLSYGDGSLLWINRPAREQAS